MCAGLAPPLEPQKTQILARGVPLVVPLVPFVVAMPFWPVMGVLDDIMICLMFESSLVEVDVISTQDQIQAKARLAKCRRLKLI